MIGKHPIQFESKTISSDTDIAKVFKKEFTNTRIHGSDKLLRKTRRKIAKLTLLGNPTFSPLQTKHAIANSKPSQAVGPDGLCKIHLKHLGPLALGHLTLLFNMSLPQNIIPQVWKNSKIISLPKPEVDHKFSTSYRPISLLCPPVKILERLIHPPFTNYLPTAT